MKRNFVLTMMVVMMAIIGVRPLYAQEPTMSSVNRNAPGIGNRGVTAANFASAGLLNTATMAGAGIQPNLSGVFDARDVAAGDFNGDGRMDIVGADTVTNLGAVVLLVGLGDGTFGCPQQALTAGKIPVAVSAMDLDLNGTTDLAVALQGAPGIPNSTGIQVMSGVFITSGGVTLTVFDTFRLTDPQAGLPVSVSFGRLNDDPFADVAVALGTGTGGGFQVLRSLPTGGYGPIDATVPIPVGMSISATVPSARAIFIEQANLCNIAAVPTTPPDADNDIFLAVNNPVGSGFALIFENQGQGIFTPFSAGFLAPGQDAATNNAAFAAGSNPVGVTAIDLDGDNKKDMIALNRGSGTVSTFISSKPTTVDPIGCGYVSPQTAFAGANPAVLSVVNFNGDGKVDLIVVNEATGTAGPGNVQLLLGNGLGAFQSGPMFGLGTIVAFPRSVAVGKFNNSSTTDDLAISLSPSTITPGGLIALIADANVTSSGVAYDLVVGELFTAISLAADFDNSGRPNDIALIDQSLAVVPVLLNVNSSSFKVGGIIVADVFTNGNLVPTSVTAVRDAITGNMNIAITDVGTPTATIGAGQIVLGLGDGSGTFIDILQFRQFTATSGATNIVNADFNNDKIEDLAYIDYANNNSVVFLNDGANRFLQGGIRETGGFIPVSATIGDFNDDDNVDLAVANQGAANNANQSIVSILLGNGDGTLRATGALLQIPNFGLSIQGGLADVEANGIRRVVDFNNDGFPDIAVASTQGGVTRPTNPTVTLLINRPEAPGTFNVQQPIELIDNLLNTNLGLADVNVVNGILNGDQRNIGGPALVTGRGGTRTGAGLVGVGVGGANYVMAVGDFQADGSPDLVVSGTRLRGGAGINNLPSTALGRNFRSSLFMVGNNTAGTMRVSRPQRDTAFSRIIGVADPLVDGCDTFVGAVTGEFGLAQNSLPDVVYLSLNGNIWVDQNITSILNHNPVVTINRADLNAPMPAPGRAGGGRKQIITAGQSAMIPVSGRDVDGDRITFSLVPTPTGERAPEFVTIMQGTDGRSATIRIASGNINPGPGQRVFRIAVEGNDGNSRLPLLGRDYFTLVVNPNAPPTVAAISNQIVEAGKTATVPLSINDPEGQTVTAAVRCDKGSFVSINGTTLNIAPQAGDVGTTTCTVTATDQFGLSSTPVSFSIQVGVANVAPTVNAIADQTVKAGNALTIPVTANDANGTSGLRINVTSSLAFVTFNDNGNGQGTIRIAPAITDTQGGRVTVMATDAGGLVSAPVSFNVTVTRAVNINSIQVPTPGSPTTLIQGIGFGSNVGDVRVNVNGTDVSSRITNVTNNVVTLKGNKRKIGFRSGPNTVTVTVGGVASDPFTFNLP